MDPISAFGLAVNILTVIDLSVKVISTASEIRSYGESITTSDRAAVAQHFESRCERLIESSKTTPEHSDGSIHDAIPTEDDVALRQLAEEAKAIARDIQRSLVKRQKGQALLKTLRDAVLSVWGEREIKEKTDRLKYMRAEIQFGLMVSIKASVDATASRRDQSLQKLDDATQQIIATLSSDNDTIRSDMERRVKNFNQEVVSHFERASQLASQRHDELLNAIADRGGLGSSLVPEDPAVITERILRRLWFSRINDRYEDILPAHKKTFGWIFSKDLRLHSSSTFLEWIENGTGMYWMSGRAGSGKSTLIKYMADDPRTEMLLRSWAHGQPLVTAKYLFWDQSSDILQKSLDGLFRGILHEIIKREGSFAPLLFPDQFKQEHGWSGPFPTSNELKRAFKRLVSLESSPTQVALLIDGLDEYSAPHDAQHDLAENLKKAACSKHMKIIASSRPETVFEKAFAYCEKLYLHDMTSRDRTLFVTDKLYEHSRTPYLVNLSGGKKAIDYLIWSAVERSEGIFLWLRLVVEALIEELDVCESIGDLQSILLQFPRGLEKLFLHMMRRMLKEHERRGFECLWLMHRSTGMRYKQSPYRFRKRNSLGTDFNYSFKLTALCMDGAQMQLDTVLNTTLGPLNSSSFDDTVKKVENRLRSWCAGLLELKPPSSSGVTSRSELKDPEVSFIHRSVAEFLELPSTCSELATGLVETSFDVDVLLMKGLLVKLKREAIAWNFGARSKIWYFVELIMRLAAFVNVGREAETSLLLAELDRSMTSLVETLRRYPACKPTYHILHLFGADHWTNYFPWALRSTPGAVGNNQLQRHDRYPTVNKRIATCVERSAGFLSIAVENGLTTFVLDTLNKPKTLPLLKAAKGVPLLSSACRPPSFSITIPGIIRPAIIHKLLDLGANPNQVYKNELEKETTPWMDMLKSFNDLEITTVEGARQFAEILTAMIKSGADQGVTILTKPLSREEALRFRTDSCSPSDDAFDLIRIHPDNGVSEDDLVLPMESEENSVCQYNISRVPSSEPSGELQRDTQTDSLDNVEEQRSSTGAKHWKVRYSHRRSPEDTPRDARLSVSRHSVESPSRARNLTKKGEICLTVQDIIRQSFINKPSFQKESDDGDIRGEFVPFEEIDSTWEIRDREWGDKHGAKYPDNSHPPQLTSSEKQIIEQMGLKLLNLLHSKEPDCEGNTRDRPVDVAEVVPEANVTHHGGPKAVQSLPDQPKVSKLIKFKALRSGLLSRFGRKRFGKNKNTAKNGPLQSE